MTMKTSLISFAAGLPGNPFTAVAAGTADIAQYFGFALNLSQQIAYLFGEDELFVGEGKEISEEVQIRLIAYLTLVSCLEQLVQQFFSIKYPRQSELISVKK